MEKKILIFSSISLGIAGLVYYYITKKSSKRNFFGGTNDSILQEVAKEFFNQTPVCPPSRVLNSNKTKCVKNKIKVCEPPKVLNEDKTKCIKKMPTSCERREVYPGAYGTPMVLNLNKTNCISTKAYYVRMQVECSLAKTFGYTCEDWLKNLSTSTRKNLIEYVRKHFSISEPSGYKPL